MHALVIIVLGVVMVALGARCAGTPGGFSTDRSGIVGAPYPAVLGTARGLSAWIGGELLQTVGYVVMMVGLLLTL